MFKTHTCLGLVAAFALTGCLSTQYDSPYHDGNAVASHHTAAPSYAQPVNASFNNSASTRFETARCPAGTTPHAGSGSCLLDDPSAGLPSASVLTASTSAVQRPALTERAQTAPRANNLVRAATAPAAPSVYMGTETTRQIGGMTYRVESGDTVYSLARKLCVSVASIQSANGLDANYAINIGQGLRLPNSQC